jgi:hypothetical protein
MSWLLASAIAGREFDALERLNSDSIAAYVPSYRKSIASRHTAGNRVITYPLFARYLFLYFDNLAKDLEALHHMRQVWPVRSDSGALLWLRDADVAALQARCAAGEFDQLAKAPHTGFAIGDHVAVNIGDTMRMATITHLLRRHRVRLAIDGASFPMVAKVELLKLAP